MISNKVLVLFLQVILRSTYNNSNSLTVEAVAVQFNLFLCTRQSHGTNMLFLNCKHACITIQTYLHGNNYLNYPAAEELGVVSHPVAIRASNKYAMQPQSRSLTRIPEQSSVKVDSKSKSNTSIAIEEITEEEEEDDYEKMQSYAVKEETIKAWRMSHFPSASSFGAPGSFTPPSLPSRRSEHFGSYPSSTPQMPSIRPRSEIHYPHSPSSPHGLQVPTSKGGHGSNQKRSSVVPSTQTTDSRSPWAQSVNTNSGGSTHTTLTSLSRSNHVVSKLPQRPPRTTTHGIGGSVASNSPQMPHKQTTKATLEGVSIHPPSPQLPPKGISAMPPSLNRSPVPSRKHDSPTLPKKPSHLSRSSADGTATEPERPFAAAATKSSQEATGNAGSNQEEESGKVNLVKARLERLEKKASTLKPALTQKPGSPGRFIATCSYSVSSNIVRLLHGEC